MYRLRDIITNGRVIHCTDYNYSPQILLSDLDDVLTRNSIGHRDYQYYGGSVGSKYSSNFGRAASQHTTSSDIYFMNDRKSQIIFSNVENAHEIVALVKSLRKLEKK